MSTRRSEIEAKRQRLLELRRLREQKQQKNLEAQKNKQIELDKQQKQQQQQKNVHISGRAVSISSSVSIAESSTSTASSFSNTSLGSNINQKKDIFNDHSINLLVDQLVGSSTSDSKFKHRSAKFVSTSTQTDSDLISQSPLTTEADSSLFHKIEEKTDFTKNDVKERKNTYDKSVQTIDFKFQEEEELLQKERELEVKLRQKIQKEIQERELKRQGELLKQSQSNSRNLQSFIDEDDDDDKNFMPVEKFLENLKQKDKDEKDQKLNQFLNRSFKIVNRTLNEDNRHLLKDYAIDSSNSDSNELDIDDEDEQIHQTRSFHNKNISKNRSVTALDFSLFHEELLLSAYSNSLSNSNMFLDHYNISGNDLTSHKSVIQIWNCNYTSNTPEYIFYSTTPIISAIFAKNSPHIIFGGGYNGKVFAWDLRANSKSPILSSPLGNGSNDAHAHPVFSLNHIRVSDSPAIKSSNFSKTNNNSDQADVLLDNKQSGSLISASTDGTICTWLPYLLSKPVTKPIYLRSPPGFLSRYDELAPTSVCFLNSDISGMIVGCEDGKIYRVKRYNSAIDKIGIDLKNIFSGHSFSAITSLAAHPSKFNYFSNFFLSSGYDWSIKLWKYSSSTDLSSSKPDIFGSSSSSSNRNLIDPSLVDTIDPVLDIKRDDVVMDVKWRPNNTSQFCSVGGSNVLEIWDLTKDLISPIHEIRPRDFDKALSKEDISDGINSLSLSEIITNEAVSGLNKVCWDKNSSNIATGSLDGYVSVFRLSGDLLTNSKNGPDNEIRLKRILADEQ
ncbi:WD40 repeat-like protein [Ascoidea rubescens DSM 1968]|uniref:WD40 repeat-like protein n=1 Tax=Ascoidea rubescens DSM 1968 TaxID=1344418 RepID=A0A1D2VQL1_9ASCO|nr:WD40 repeat-like protein [Ascoidea rubescens DSM 1968]ODV63894.1 WD40 repeat-like protein [Ascoidea rubescens DSM 1968]